MSGRGALSALSSDACASSLLPGEGTGEQPTLRLRARLSLASSQVPGPQVCRSVLASGTVVSSPETPWACAGNVTFRQESLVLLLSLTRENHSSALLPCAAALSEMLRGQQGSVGTKTLYSQFSIPLSGLVFLLLNCRSLTSCISNGVVIQRKNHTGESGSLAVCS